MENFFRRAVKIEQEKNSTYKALRLQAEGESGVDVFKKGTVGEMVAAGFLSLNKDLVTRITAEF